MPLVLIAVDGCPRALTYTAASALEPGVAVDVPYRTSMRRGLVVGESQPLPPDVTVKPVAAVIGARWTPGLARLAQWAARYYGGDPAAIVDQVACHACVDPPQRDVVYVRRGAWPGDGISPRAPTRAALHGLWLSLPDSDDGDDPWIQQDELRLDAPSRKHLDRLIQAGAIMRETRTSDRAITLPVSAQDELPALTDEQQVAVDDIGRDVVASKTAVVPPRLIYGVTGSGKTIVYMAAAQPIIRAGGQVLILVPEIALTGALISRIQRVIPKTVAIHSGMSEQVRQTAIRMARDGDVDVVIGPRSALWTPMPRLGLIIADEEHDASYKQGSGIRWHGRDLAICLAKDLRIPIVLGSATPSLETWRNVSLGRYSLSELTRRPPGVTMPHVQVHDMSAVKRDAGRGILVAPALVDDMRVAVSSGKKCLVMLNRRGFSTKLTCGSCGDVVVCGGCDRPMVLHRRAKELRCHRCGTATPLPSACPSCASPQLSGTGYGTERLMGILSSMVPGLVPVRLDADTAGANGHAAIMSRFLHGDANCLIGTQMIAKGLDCPTLTVVGVIDADMGLHAEDDPRAGERVFHLIAQVSGRAGRGTSPGIVHVQVDNPDHPAVHGAAYHQHQAFYTAEAERRNAVKLPPWTPWIRLIWESPMNKIHLVDRLASRIAAVASAHGWQAQEVLVPPIGMIQGRGRRACLIVGSADARRSIPALVADLRCLEPKPIIDVDPLDVS